MGGGESGGGDDGEDPGMADMDDFGGAPGAPAGDPAGGPPGGYNVGFSPGYTQTASLGRGYSVAAPPDENVVSTPSPIGDSGMGDMTGFGTTAPGAGSDMPEASGGVSVGAGQMAASAISLGLGLGPLGAVALGLLGYTADKAFDTSDYFTSDLFGDLGATDLMGSYSTDDIGPTGAPEGAGVGYARARRASGAGPSNLRAIPPARSATSVARDEEAALRTAARQRRARAVARSPVASTLGSTGGTATIKTLLGA